MTTPTNTIDLTRDDRTPDAPLGFCDEGTHPAQIDYGNGHKRCLRHAPHYSEASRLGWV